MKHLIPVILALTILSACNNSDADSTKTNADSSNVSAEKLDYPYTLNQPNDWQWGDKKNALMVLKSLKAYETGNIDECASYFGDTVDLRFDQFEKKVTKDSLNAIFTKSRGENKTMEIKMDDWESVISSDKKIEYVSLWYKEIWEDQKGKKDSASMMDDLRIKDGKIVSIDQKMRRYAVNKL